MTNNIRNREATLAKLQGGVRICPSLLNCDFAELAAEIESAKSCGAASVHWDVMDGDFVPNFTYGPPIIRSLRPRSDMIFDAHLMMSRPEKYLDDFLDAGCDIITVHLEAVPETGALIEKIQAAGALAGLAINPPTPVETLQPWLERVDLALIMSVSPGFGGQTFDPGALDKLKWVHSRFPDRLLVQVDGGVNRQTIGQAVRAGAKLCVVGSAFYGAENRQEEFNALMDLTR